MVYSVESAVTTLVVLCHTCYRAIPAGESHALCHTDGDAFAVCMACVRDAGFETPEAADAAVLGVRARKRTSPADPPVVEVELRDLHWECAGRVSVPKCPGVGIQHAQLPAHIRHDGRVYARAYDRATGRHVYEEMAIVDV